MQAVKDIHATFNGCDYAFKKGQAVKAPQALVDALKKQGIVKAVRAKKEEQND